MSEAAPRGRRGAVAVISRHGKLLVIRRAEGIAAPGKFCFPGGGIEAGETESQAVMRELDEELGVAVRPVRLLWRNMTEWGVDLVYWHALLDPAATFVPNPAEVASMHWFTLDELAALDELLTSNRQFVDVLRALWPLDEAE